MSPKTSLQFKHATKLRRDLVPLTRSNTYRAAHTPSTSHRPRRRGRVVSSAISRYVVHLPPVSDSDRRHNYTFPSNTLVCLFHSSRNEMRGIEMRGNATRGNDLRVIVTQLLCTFE